MTISIQTLIDGYSSQHDMTNPGNSDMQPVFDLLNAGLKLTPKAQFEFSKAFALEFALDGVLYVGSPRNASIQYPTLMAEVEAIGIRTINR